ncbi:22518_t:CDS:2, partial [Racocetra persica]
MSTHEWQAPGPDDKRSPCPALNTLANHGYLPRGGENITGHGTPLAF